MDTRRILQIFLGLIVVSIVVVGALLIYHVTREAETVVVKQVASATQVQEERRNPWEEQSDVAITLVKRVTVRIPGERPRRGPPPEDTVTSIGELLEDETFVREKLKILSGTKVGWQAQWWGETKHGPSFFLIRYAFQDANITVGPTWLVDLRTQKVVAKNVLASVVANPAKGVESDYYDKAQQVVSAITNHRFESKINLGGALVLYFEQHAGGAESDTILGWTIDHERGNLFKAYFQWVENDESTYAEFEFDFDAKALKAVNLQAAELMRVGEEFERTERVSVMPGQYDPKQLRPERRWQGQARKVCSDPRHRDGCKALATVYDQAELVETLEWLLTARANTAEEFEACKQARLCRWIPEDLGEGFFKVNYSYNLDSSEESAGEQTISWKVSIKNGEIEPLDRISQLAFRSIHPRS